VIEIVRFKKFAIKYYGGKYIGTFLDKSGARNYAKRKGWIVDYIKEID
jgi:hypothetical protein